MSGASLRCCVSTVGNSLCKLIQRTPQTSIGVFASCSTPTGQQLHWTNCLAASAACRCSSSMSDNSTRFRIYTKTGDKGTSGLFNSQRRPKDDDVFHALGDVDELNSTIGVAHEFCTAEHKSLQAQLVVIMSRLLDVGSALSTPADSSSQQKLARTQFPEGSTAQLEAWLDAMDDSLPPLKNFILPSGGAAAAHLHLARSVCRRAERSVVPLVRSEAVDPEVGVYLNRLSDYLFTAARYAAQRDGNPEIVYKKGGVTKLGISDPAGSHTHHAITDWVG